MPESSEFRRERARLAAFTRWSGSTPSDRSRRARKAFRTRFENQVDPDRKLTPADRAVLVDAAIDAHYARMRLARARKKETA